MNITCMKVLLCLCCLLVLSCEATTDENLTRIRKAQKLFDAARQNKQHGMESPEKAFITSAELFVAASRGESVDKGKLLYNAGNAYYLSGQIGKALVHYYRARRLRPDDQKIQYNIRLVRSNVEGQPKVKENAVLRGLLFFHYGFPLLLRYITGLLLVFVSGITLITRLKVNRSWQVPVISVCLCVGSVFLVSVFMEKTALNDSSLAVVVADEVMPREGSSSAYDPSFDIPLYEGTVIHVKKKRDGWIYAEFDENGGFWLPQRSVEFVTADVK